MVGHVMGLGDRHGENILVDFNCLFEASKLLKVPERVPFRLKQNIVSAFGVGGVEGVLRKSCQVTMSVLRENHDLLMTLVETFVHDPLLEWKSGLMNGPKVCRQVGNKLKGLSGDGLQLSVEGQMDELINQATDKKLLAAMYCGWAPHM